MYIIIIHAVHLQKDFAYWRFVEYEIIIIKNNFLLLIKTIITENDEYAKKLTLTVQCSFFSN